VTAWAGIAMINNKLKILTDFKNLYIVNTPNLSFVQENHPSFSASYFTKFTPPPTDLISLPKKPQNSPAELPPYSAHGKKQDYPVTG
jgi:hypothetical protein